MLKDKWIEQLKELMSNAPIPMDPPDITAIISEATGKIKQTVSHGLENNTAHHLLLRDLEKQLHGDNSDFKLVRTHYLAMHSKYMQLKNTRKQEAWADLQERIRYLFFRILTAIGIAAVILGTAYLANRWDIPLPLLRMV